jgi:hypothetical protein
LARQPDQLASEDMAQTASLRYPRRRLISTAHSRQKGDFVIY